jgi:hypothetical protein
MGEATEASSLLLHSKSCPSTVYWCPIQLFPSLFRTSAICRATPNCTVRKGREPFPGAVLCVSCYGICVFCKSWTKYVFCIVYEQYVIK